MTVRNHIAFVITRELIDWDTHIRKAVVAPNDGTTQLGHITIGLQSKYSRRKAEELVRR